MTEALTDFLSVLVNGAVTLAMVALIVAFAVCAIAPFFGKGQR